VSRRILANPALLLSEDPQKPIECPSVTRPFRFGVGTV